MKRTNAALAALLACCLTGCIPHQVPNGDNLTDPPANEVFTPEGLSNAEATNDDVGLGYDPVRRDQARGFSAWVVQVPGAVWGAAVSGEERQRYAVTQNNASDALLAYEQANDYYSRIRGIALAVDICHLRDDIWATKASERLGVIQRADRSRQRAREALSSIEVDTADAFSSYIAITAAQFVTGSGPTPDCADLASMPFLVTLDRFLDGEIADLPRPPG